MKKYEYRVEPVKVAKIGMFDDSKKQTKHLNEIGAQGWKLVCLTEGKKYLKYVFIREVE